VTPVPERLRAHIVPAAIHLIKRQVGIVTRRAALPDVLPLIFHFCLQRDQARWGSCLFFKFVFDGEYLFFGSPFFERETCFHPSSFFPPGGWVKVSQSQGSRMGKGRRTCCSAIQDEAGVVESDFLPRHMFHTFNLKFHGLGSAVWRELGHMVSHMASQAHVSWSASWGYQMS